MICCTHVYTSLFLKRTTLNRNEQVNASMTRKAKITIIIALMLGMALAALDTTIVGTALPSIVGKLGGITLYSWVFSAYLITSCLVPSSLSTKKIASWQSFRIV